MIDTQYEYYEVLYDTIHASFVLFWKCVDGLFWDIATSAWRHEWVIRAWVFSTDAHARLPRDARPPRLQNTTPREFPNKKQDNRQHYPYNYKYN